MLYCSAALDAALGSAIASGDRLIDALVLLAMGELALVRDEPRRAVVHLPRALDLFRRPDVPRSESRAFAVPAEANAADEGYARLGRTSAMSNGIW